MCVRMRLVAWVGLLLWVAVGAMGCTGGAGQASGEGAGVETGSAGQSQGSAQSPAVPPPPSAAAGSAANGLGSGTGGGSTAANGLPSVEQLLPANGQTVDVMDVVISDRLQQISRKFQAAVQRDPEWFQQLVQRTKPGETLPYDSRMGVTEEEYRELQQLAQQSMLERTGGETILARRDGDRIHFGGRSSLDELNGVVIDLATRTLQTPYGEATFDGLVVASDGQQITGPWDGYSWRLTTGNPTTGGSQVKLSLGRLVESGRGLLLYEVKHVDENIQKNIRYLLMYDLGAKSAGPTYLSP